MELLKVENLCIQADHYKEPVQICKELSFSLKAGENMGILGESGSGKSITSLAILGLLPPKLSITQGSISYTCRDGQVIDLVNYPSPLFQKIRGKDISMIFQEPMSALNPVFTCGDQVRETIRQHYPQLSQNEVKSKVIELFEKVKLPHPQQIYSSYPHQLSGGQKQRVMISAAISCQPRLLIADEPTTALDVTVQQSILSLLKELQSELKMSILFITHDISVIAEIAQRIMVMYKGEIVEQGEMRQILYHPKHVYTKGLLSCRSSVHKKGEPLMTLEDTFGQIAESEPTKTSEFICKQEESSVDNKKEEVLLTIRNLIISFPLTKKLFRPSSYKTIIKGVSFNVLKGETLGLVGESGSGKTTIGRSVMKLIESHQGEILYKGIPAHQLSGQQLQEYRKKVQIIFQDPYSSLNPKMTVGETISEPLFVHNLKNSKPERKERVMELLHLVGLKEEHYNRYPHQFSGGQRQRIGIARALAMEPELIILDESVSALDVSVQAQILNLLNQLKKSLQLTYIFISHDLNTVHYMADRLIVLQNGEIVEKGKVEDIFRSPKNDYTIRLLESIPGKNI